MSEIPYTPLPGKIRKYFEKFQEVAIPQNKVNTSWLKTLGFKSGNDAYILRVLKYIRFIDASGNPTEFWRQYKDPTKAKVVMAQAIKQGYKELFGVYPDAFRKDREALYAFFSSKTGKAKSTPSKLKETVVSVKPEKDIIRELHINIQLHLPATNDPTVYDNLFKSLKKHLLSAEENAS